jgi:hypothetical protein
LLYIACLQAFRLDTTIMAHHRRVLCQVGCDVIH